MKRIFIFLVIISSLYNLNSQTLIGQELFGNVAQERFGSRVDISADGQTLAIKTGKGKGSKKLIIK
ncbi:hypothetical protein [uncultured Winogradskyella sp.]|uniref:hypothetical protein n=1 Tax=uncultured Winogradskyella sp. TaxID=395353 RepID=UPI0026384BC7|nr:hypothetical protein [uncultured Winogradskyella sp.]